MDKSYITTSIAYANASPHIGFALESVQADVVARYRRQKNGEVFFLTGTDEHGTKIYRAAHEKNLPPQKFVDEIADEFKNLKNILNLDWDGFIRTTDKENHWPAVEKIWKKLRENGDIEKRIFKGLYCVGCEDFITEKDLVDGKCPIHQKEPEVIEEENYFFKLSKYAEELKSRIKKDKLKIIPETRKNETLAFLKERLRDVSVSRSRDKLPWGIPVPGDESQVIYVWIDALINYLSGLGYPESDNFKKFWSENSEIMHFIGKDIFRFHTIIWPAILLSVNLPLPKKIFVHGFITVNGQKISKSDGNVVDPKNLVGKYGTDAVRYFLLREISPFEDGDFSKEKFRERYNGELANGLGNFAARVLTLASRNANLQIHNNTINEEIKEKIDFTEKITEQKINEFKFNEALSVIWDLIKYGDNYVNQTKLWENTENKSAEIANLIFLLQAVSQMILPFLPETSEKISKNIKISGDNLEVSKPENLFPRFNE
ncbi:MAG: class I tRNA ligase family protein [Patescibacteria group bacterium]|nr:class I tRNA ligase family protein [Patescibacteria group bacterium]